MALMSFDFLDLVLRFGAILFGVLGWCLVGCGGGLGIGLVILLGWRYAALTDIG